MEKLKSLAKLASLLALIVVILGAYTRLTDSGLGCPDWPGCYGHVFVPAANTIAGLEVNKAWIEMIHRYVAGSLGLLLVFIMIKSINTRKQGSPWLLASILVVVVSMQALLGMWTVTLKLYPVVVLAHLLGGMTILSLCWFLYLRLNDNKKINKVNLLAKLALFAVFVQIALGGWTSANYAALVCSDFPSCQGQLWPQMDWSSAFNLTKVGIFDSPGTPLENSARVTIQVAHRCGALLVTGLVIALSIRAYRKAKSLTLIILGLLVMQIGLGITNVLAQLPLWAAVLHNGVAAGLLLSILTVDHKLSRVTK